MIRIAVIGFGYWGPNLVRNFTNTGKATVSWICDVSPKRCEEAKRQYPWTKTTSNYRDVFADPTCNGIVIATPVTTHFPLGKAALNAGKHVLIEKPMTFRSHEAASLIALAKKMKKILMVDHTFVYTPAIQIMYELIKHNELGTILSIDSVRTNLGIIQKDVNVIYDLATHDFSIIDFLLKRVPTSISAIGTNHDMIKQETSAYITARYPKNIFVHVHVSWLTPVKIRRMMIVGTKKMLVYDDNESSEKIKVYDRGVHVMTDPTDSYQQRVGYRTGAIVSPFVPLEEGLAAMAKAFVAAIKTGKPPQTDGKSGLRVVKILERANESLGNKKSMLRL